MTREPLVVRILSWVLGPVRDTKAAAEEEAKAIARLNTAVDDLLTVVPDVYLQNGKVMRRDDHHH